MDVYYLKLYTSPLAECLMVCVFLYLIQIFLCVKVYIFPAYFSKTCSYVNGLCSYYTYLMLVIEMKEVLHTIYYACTVSIQALKFTAFSRHLFPVWTRGWLAWHVFTHRRLASVARTNVTWVPRLRVELGTISNSLVLPVPTCHLILRVQRCSWN